MLHLLMGLAFGEEVGLEASGSQFQDVPEQPFQIGVEPDVFLAIGGTSGLPYVPERRVCWCRNELVACKRQSVSGIVDVLWDSGLGGVSATVGPRIGVFI